MVPTTGGTSAPTTQIPPMQSVPQSDGDKVKLASQTHGIMIEAHDSDIIGRKNGAFTGVFGSFSYVSGTHCKIVKNAAGWHIQDMGSTNGTFCNGTTLVPNTLYPLANGTTIKIADVELLVTYDETGSGTVRI
jgi:pSer/pThr/pTyr-binding forkhead associated (FHA) protein